jgi:methionine synthase I (cobalamin-dependent)
MKLLGALDSRVLLSDGAMGTELAARGVDTGSPQEFINTGRTGAAVQSIHESYLAAGSAAILTNTFRAVRTGLQRADLSARALNAPGVDVARRARGTSPAWILGDMTSTGQQDTLALALGRDEEPTVRREFHDLYRDHAAALAEAGADGLLLETMDYLEETVVAVRAAVEAVTIPVFCTMTFRAVPDADVFLTIWGSEPVARVVPALVAAGAAGIGANCGDVVERMPEVARQMRALTDLPLVFHINAGMPDPETGRHPHDPARFAGIARDVVSAAKNARGGGVLIGGCCGTGPAHIAALRDALRG